MWMWFQKLPRLRYKIILPFLALSILVGLAGAAIAFFLVADAIQSDFTTNLLGVTRSVHDQIVEQERENLNYLRQVAFAPANDALEPPAPGVPEALEGGDATGLQRALDPYLELSVREERIQLHRLIVFDEEGQTLADFERTSVLTPLDQLQEADPDASLVETGVFTVNTALNFADSGLMEPVLESQRDNLGDKFATIIRLPDASGEQHYYFCTIVPVFSAFQMDEDEQEAAQADRQPTPTPESPDELTDSNEPGVDIPDVPDRVVGGIIMGIRIDGTENNLLQRLSRNNGADFVTIYDTQGNALFTNDAPMTGINALDIGAESAGEIKDGNTVNHTLTVDGQEYQLTYSPLRIRGDTVGIISAALSRDTVTSQWAKARLPVGVLALTLLVGIIWIGNYISHLITAPIDELVDTATSVTTGKGYRRSEVQVRDEVGILANSFNRMTEFLLSSVVYVRNIYSQRAAIVENLGEGVVVCDEQGVVHLINSATRRLLNLDMDALPPATFADLPLTPLDKPVFDGQSEDLYMLGSYIVRMRDKSFQVPGQHSGYVYVLQDMTAEVNVQLARTNFIATISHEMRTPLTPMRANMDMLRSGIAGTLNDQQRAMIDDISQQVSGMVAMVDNMTTVAGLDSGAMKVEPEAVALKPVVEKGVWPLRKVAKSKDLDLKIEIPEDIPQVMADTVQLRTIVKHLVDNAIKYTDTGGVTITAAAEATHVRVDVQDTGCGIEYHMTEKIFERLVRDEGDRSNERSVRGIGLGLSIVKQLVELHRGRVWVISQPGQGSTFSFTLPYANVSGGPGSQESNISTAA